MVLTQNGSSVSGTFTYTSNYQGGRSGAKGEAAAICGGYGQYSGPITGTISGNQLKLHWIVKTDPLQEGLCPFFGYTFGSEGCPYPELDFNSTLPSNQIVYSLVYQSTYVSGKDSCAAFCAYRMSIVLAGHTSSTCSGLSLTEGLAPTAPTTGDTNIYLTLTWSGKIPSGGLTATLQSTAGPAGTSFIFNPVRLLSPRVTFLMDVTTNHTPDGTYTATVTATVTDPATNKPCSTSAKVNFTVSGTTVFQKFGTVSGVQGNVQRIGPDGKAVPLQQAKDVNPGDVVMAKGGSVTLATPGGTVKTDGQGDKWWEAAMLRLNKEIEFEIAWKNLMDELFARMSNLPPATSPPPPPPTFLQRMEAAWASLKNLIPSRADVVDTLVMLGTGRFTVSYSNDCYTYSVRALLCSVYITPTVAIIPKGTAFTVTLSPDGTTTIAMQQGSASIMDIASGSSVTLSQGQTLSVPYTSSGLSQQALQAAIQSTTLSSVTSQTAPQSTVRSYTTSQTSTYRGRQYDFTYLLIALSFFIVIVLVVVSAVYSRRHYGTQRSSEEARRKATRPPQITSRSGTGGQTLQPPVEAKQPSQSTERIFFCPNCGKPVEEGIKFCGKCGAKV